MPDDKLEKILAYLKKNFVKCEMSFCNTWALTWEFNGGLCDVCKDRIDRDAYNDTRDNYGSGE